ATGKLICFFYALLNMGQLLPGVTGAIRKQHSCSSALFKINLFPSGDGLLIKSLLPFPVKVQNINQCLGKIPYLMHCYVHYLTEQQLSLCSSSGSAASSSFCSNPSVPDCSESQQQLSRQCLPTWFVTHSLY
uniref:Uncharacterized protein n=1 Tax=Geospiza parvula TaxID=87175 RepID=A0A8C3N4F5_GEOPR